MSDRIATKQAAAAARLRLAAVLTTVVLLALVLRWVLVAPSIARIVIAAVVGVPVALGAPFLHAGHRRTYIWMTLALAPALILGLTEAVANPASRAWATLLLLDLLATFALLIAYLRATGSSSPP
ncbi:MAG TPA: DUF2069 domain-containing protein [Steroidobacteraceae bacterium]|nr:DUF2069 domain-containing protein [Steroidobacteraceae bacterium]